MVSVGMFDHCEGFQNVYYVTLFLQHSVFYIISYLRCYVYFGNFVQTNLY